MTKKEPWEPNTATDMIRSIARKRNLTVTYKLHAKERLEERNLIASDVLYALKNGFVYNKAVPATRPDMYRYRVECKTPNSGSRAIGVVVIPSVSGCLLKIVSVMWIDEYERVAGTIVGEDDEEN
ncbi:DUF4258 domain-containing protein [Rhizobium sp. CNPSo 3968]|uniref:DUF4258 domain-containing protein n=1 Tax=Rhizobium sp. CNPSo 3968 TaxID=3021408 RepID=UPI002550350D|nr:DUF4258 domain-containing protein [Rhizobium sp. CNPSo 3968]MDK4723390.1 DUF4258 domain-containing protein [Rhizobium sp. CNPSo 3968]